MPDTMPSATSCPVCGALEAAVLQRYPHPSAERHRTLLRCGACGMVHIAPPVPLRFAELPESAYQNDWEGVDPKLYEHFYARLEDALLRLAPNVIKRFLGEHRRLIDVGCGPGLFLDLARARGWEVAGVEPWRALAQWGRKHLKLDVFPGPLAESSPGEASYDVVVAYDVLSYVADPVGFLERCLGLLKPGGVLHLVVPNFDARARVQAGFASPSISPLTHLLYFTQETLTAAVRKAGFVRIAAAATDGPDGDALVELSARRPVATSAALHELADDKDDPSLPPLDRLTVDESRLSPEQRHWREQGFLIKERLIPEPLIDAYCRVRERLGEPGGWVSPYPYMQVPEIRDLCLHRPLMDLLEHLIGNPMGMHLNLTGWVSTEREWHQDDYLNPPEVQGHYAAVWFALDRIDPDSGPFEFVPGSNRWPLIKRDKVLARLPDTSLADLQWPIKAERLLTPIFESEIERRELPIRSFLGGKGDVLIWHARLLHRGSMARRRGALRKAIIAHYSSIQHRPDMPAPVRHRDQGYYFPFGEEPVVQKSGRLLKRLFGT